MGTEPVDARRRLAAAKQIAQEILQEHEIDKAPVPIEEIVTSSGASVDVLPMISDGSISWRGRIPRIKVNSRNGEVRQRFTMAHEFGHLIWKEKYGFSEVNAKGENTEPMSGTASLEERFCSMFASYILVPGQELSWLVDWGSLSLAGVEAAAERFRVSFQTLLWRIVESSPDDAGAILLEADPHLRTGLRVRWAVFPKRHGFFYPDGEVVPFSADLHRAWREGGESFVRGYPLKIGNFADDRDLRLRFHGDTLAIAVFPRREA